MPIQTLSNHCIACSVVGVFEEVLMMCPLCVIEILHAVPRISIVAGAAEVRAETVVVSVNTVLFAPDALVIVPTSLILVRITFGLHRIEEWNVSFANRAATLNAHKGVGAPA